MTGYGFALRWRMWALAMVDGHVDQVSDQTRNHGKRVAETVVVKHMDKPKPV
jgi:hypothetical protein